MTVGVSSSLFSNLWQECPAGNTQRLWSLTSCRWLVMVIQPRACNCQRRLCKFARGSQDRQLDHLLFKLLQSAYHTCVCNTSSLHNGDMLGERWTMHLQLYLLQTLGLAVGPWPSLLEEQRRNSGAAISKRACLAMSQICSMYGWGDCKAPAEGLVARCTGAGH